MGNTTGGSLQIWMILLIASVFLMILIGANNFYVPKYGEIRAKIMSQRSMKERSNCIISMSKHIDEDIFVIMIAMIYVAVSTVFAVENRFWLLSQIGNSPLIWLGLFILWLTVGFIAVAFGTALMLKIEQNSKKELKQYYYRHYGITLISQDHFDDNLTRF